jgi:hypothetical protein
MSAAARLGSLQNNHDLSIGTKKRQVLHRANAIRPVSKDSSKNKNTHQDWLKRTRKEKGFENLIKVQCVCVL